MKKVLTLLALLVGFSAAAVAQTNPPTPPPYGVIGGYISAQAAANTNATVQLPANGAAFGAVTFVNTGTKDCYLVLGGSGVTATTSSIPLRSGKHWTTWVGSNTYFGVITGGTDTTTLDVYQSTGPISFGP